MEPNPSVQFRHELRIADGVHDVTSELPLQLLVANFTTKSGTLPKAEYIANAKHNSIALLTPGDEIAQGVGAALRVSEQTFTTDGCVQ